MVRKYTYAVPPTTAGLKGIEEGTLEILDTNMFANLNTGILEQYLNEKNRVEGFETSNFDWKKVGIGIFIGCMFAMINQYVGLKAGIIVGGTWYITYIIGLALKWSPSEINIASGAGTGTDRTATGFVFTFPALYLLAYSKNYVDASGNNVIQEIPSITIPLVGAMLGAFLGIMYFTIFRRVWLVEDPLPVPGFEAYVKLADISRERATTGAEDSARESINRVVKWSLFSGVFTFLKEFPIKAFDEHSILDHWFKGDYFSHGDLIHPEQKYTYFAYGLIPIQFAIGWFMRGRAAVLVSLGTLFSWFIVIPLAVHLDVAVYYPLEDGFVNVTDSLLVERPMPSSMFAYSYVARIIAIGAILGGGITALIKMAPVFKKATDDIVKLTLKKEEEEDMERKDFVEGKGWYEWPVTHIPYVAGIVFLGMSLVFIIGGYPIIPSILFGLLLVVATFLLGCIAVKVMGEVAITPVSGLSFIVLLLLYFTFVIFTNKLDALVMAIVGTTIFGTCVSLSADLTHDFKIGLYVGSRPFHLVKGEMTGVIPGTIISAIFSTIISYLLAKGELNLPAPQANAFATIAQSLLGGEVPYVLLAMGFVVGIWAELFTGRGTAFGLGMYLPLAVTLPLLTGGLYRDYWNTKTFAPRAEREGWDEKRKTLEMMKTYMTATGLIVGEALMGTIIAIYLIFTAV